MKQNTFKQFYNRNLLVIFAFILLAIQFSCNSSSHIKGQIVDNQNKPLENVEIKLVKFKPREVEFTTQLLEVTKTNKNGDFKVNVPEIEKDKKFLLVFLKQGYTGKPVSFTNAVLRKHSQVFNNYFIILQKTK